MAGIPWPFLLQQAALLLMLRSTSQRLDRSPGGVRWRDTFYPLEMLRRGVVRTRDGRRPGDAPDRL